ncbi:MAG: FimV/HubP family polar landmark protein [Pseudomonadota bacterium]
MLKKSITLISLGCTISSIPCVALDLAPVQHKSYVNEPLLATKDPPTDNVKHFSEEGALSALSDLEMLESKAMSTQKEDKNETVWNLDNDLANRTEWTVSDERSLQEIAVHVRPSSAVSIEQTLVALIKKNATVVQQRQSLALNQGDRVQLPTREEIAAVNKLSASHELGALQARFQVMDPAANEADQAATASVAPTTANGLPGGRLRLGRPEPTTPDNAQSVQKSQQQQSLGRTKSTDLERRLENAVARLGDANHVINTHIHEIAELNLLVEDLKHTIDLKNAELADMQARALGAMQAQDSVGNSAKVASGSDPEPDGLLTETMKEETNDSGQQHEAVAEPAAATSSSRAILGGFLAIVAAMFSTITFARFRARLTESRAARLSIEQERSNNAVTDNAAQDTRLRFDDEELQQLFDCQNGSVIGEAEVLTEHGLHSQAIAHLNTALEQNPESSELIGALREALILAGQYEKAAELFPELESANDNAEIDSDYMQQTLVIDDLEEPFDESKPPVWEPPAASYVPSSGAKSDVEETSIEPTLQNQPQDTDKTEKRKAAEKVRAATEKSDAKNAPAANELEQKRTENNIGKVNTSPAAQPNKLSAAEKAAAKKQTRRAKKARRQQEHNAVNAKKTSTVGKKVPSAGATKQVPARQTESAEIKVQISDQAVAVSSVVSETESPKKTSKVVVAEQPAVAVAETNTVDQQVANDKENIEMLIGNTDVFTEVEATPFELVQAYIELDDRDGARRMLEDILGDGKPNEKVRAKELLAEIA